MKKQSNALVVIALLLFFPILAYVPSASAQDETMEFVMAYFSDFEGLNPLFGYSERARWYSMCVYDSLLSSDENLDLIPWLAEEYNVSTDGFEVTFTLREGAVWHDGQPVTPEDVKFTFELIRDGPYYTMGGPVIQHVVDVAIIDQTIIVTLDQVISWAAYVLGSVPILPKHIREGSAIDSAAWDDHTNLTAHIGSGMFRYVARTPGEYTLLERFDDWWGPSNPLVGQLPNIESVRIDVVRTQEARIMAMRNGDIDTELYEVSGAFINTVLNAPELKLLTGVPTLFYYDLGMNTVMPGLDEFEVRRAIAYAIDRQELINIGRLGFGTSIKSVIPEAFYPGFYHPDGNFPEYNISIANQILDSAGWIDNDMNGIRENETGVELSYNLWVDSSDDFAMSTGIGMKLQLEEIGIEVNVEPLVWEVMRQGIQRVPRTFEMFIFGSYFYSYPSHPWVLMHSDNYVDRGWNPYGCINSTLDAILEDYQSSSPTELVSKARAVQIAATENMPYIPLYVSDDTHALRTEWINFSTKPGGSFTSMVPETMVFMYDSELGPPTPPEAPDLILLAGVGIGAFVVGVACTYIAFRRR
ncbi:MAG: ABC transporter substrate-binding protein [Candidatus Thorarchaeota archaeon]|jgi:peptide/nickel transport system substrate-binding protein